ncbi:MAG TPA: BrnT family toxin [Lichenihabitans sp.]|jgi:hypothetical protein|nr:BrnT family toxin [Lichenihabitans sp.]
MITVSLDPRKWQATFERRGLDFADAPLVFGGITADMIDGRRDYGEERIVTIGTLRGRTVVIVWTQRDEARHVISMRKANEREQNRFRQRLSEG